MARAARLMAVVVLSALLAPAAWGARVEATESDRLILRSSLIIEATVLDVDLNAGVSDPTAGGLTRLTVRVEAALKGDAAGDAAGNTAGNTAGARITLMLPEGTLPDGRLRVIAGGPKPAVGHRYLLFFADGAWGWHPYVDPIFGVLRRVSHPRGEAWVTESGRCVAGFTRARVWLGPTLAAAPGWPGLPRVARPAPIATAPIATVERGACLPADALLARLRGRVAELGVASDPVVFERRSALSLAAIWGRR